AALEVVVELLQNGPGLVLCNQLPSDKHLEGVRHFQPVKSREWNLARILDGRAGVRREALRHVQRNQSARIGVRHRSPRSWMTMSEPPGAITRSPNTARVRA